MLLCTMRFFFKTKLKKLFKKKSKTQKTERSFNKISLRVFKLSKITELLCVHTSQFTVHAHPSLSLPPRTPYFYPVSWHGARWPRLAMMMHHFPAHSNLFSKPLITYCGTPGFCRIQFGNHWLRAYLYFASEFHAEINCSASRFGSCVAMLMSGQTCWYTWVHLDEMLAAW